MSEILTNAQKEELQQQELRELGRAAGNQRLEFERNDLLVMVREKVFGDTEVKTTKER
jgi:hypothetical protein